MAWWVWPLAVVLAVEVALFALGWLLRWRPGGAQAAKRGCRGEGW